MIHERVSVETRKSPPYPPSYNKSQRECRDIGCWGAVFLQLALEFRCIGGFVTCNARDVSMAWDAAGGCSFPNARRDFVAVMNQCDQFRCAVQYDLHFSFFLFVIGFQ